MLNSTKQRNLVERFFGRIKASFRRIATRYEKTSQNFHGNDKTSPLSDYGVSFMSPLPR